MAKIYASDPNDLRSRITDRCKPRDETDAVHPRLCNADNVKEMARLAHLSRSSDGGPNCPSAVFCSNDLNQVKNPRVNLPAGKPPSIMSKHAGVGHHLPSDGLVDINQQNSMKVSTQMSPTSHRLPSPPRQFPSHPTSVNMSTQCILLLESELELQKELDFVIGQKKLMRDADSRESYMVVLQREIAIRKQLQQVL